MSRTPDELLNAYLDGELTADEQARVEQRLAESAEFRQLHEELVAVRSGLENLPQFRLGPDFAERVLRKAELAMLATGPEGDSQAPLATPSEKVLSQPDTPQGAEIRASPPLSRNSSWKIGGRIAAWAGACAAAIALLIVYQPARERANNSEVAQAPNDADAFKRPASTDAIAANPAAGGKSNDSTLEQAADDAAPGQFKPAENHLATDDASSPDRDKAGFERELRHDFDQDRPTGLPANLPEQRTADKDKFATKDAAKAFGLAPGDAAPPASAPGLATGGAAGPAVAPPAVLNPSIVPTEKIADKLAAKNVEGIVQGDAIDAWRERLAGHEQGTGLLIVQVDVTPEAAKSGAIQQFLAVNGRLANRNKAPLLEKEEAAESRDERQPNSAPNNNEQRSPRLRVIGGVATGDFDAIEISADKAQLEATLTQLQADRDHVLNISIEPALGDKAKGDSARGEAYQYGEARKYAETRALPPPADAPTFALQKTRELPGGTPAADGKWAVLPPQPAKPLAAHGAGQTAGDDLEGNGKLDKKAGAETAATPPKSATLGTAAPAPTPAPVKGEAQAATPLADSPTTDKAQEDQTADEKGARAKGPNTQRGLKEENASRRTDSLRTDSLRTENLRTAEPESPAPQARELKDAARGAPVAAGKTADTYHALFLFRVVSPTAPAGPAVQAR